MRTDPRRTWSYAPFLAAFLIQPFLHSEAGYFALLVAIVLSTFAIHYERNEWLLFIVGLLFGFAFEALGGLVYRLQYWENASLFGIPTWLPVLWGFGFVMIRRLGNDILAMTTKA